LIILALIIVIAVLVKLVEFFRSDIVEADASNFVLEDLREKYPAADIGIVSILEEYNDYGGKYFEVKARVTQDAYTPCPKRSHIFYNYPDQNFVPQPPAIITSNCHVCTTEVCTVAFPEEAIIASHTFDGTEKVQQYLTVYPNSHPVVKEMDDLWSVSWDFEDADLAYIVKIRRDGRIMDVLEIDK